MAPFINWLHFSQFQDSNIQIQYPSTTVIHSPVSLIFFQSAAMQLHTPCGSDASSIGHRHLCYLFFKHYYLCVPINQFAIEN